MCLHANHPQTLSIRPIHFPSILFPFFTSHFLSFFLSLFLASSDSRWFLLLFFFSNSFDRIEKNRVNSVSYLSLRMYSHTLMFATRKRISHWLEKDFYLSFFFLLFCFGRKKGVGVQLVFLDRCNFIVSRTKKFFRR